MSLLTLRSSLLLAFMSLVTLARALDVSVSAGGDIQSAIDKVAAAGGGSVTLATGTYLLSTTLQIADKVRLSGQGSASTEIVGGDFPVIKQAREGLRDVVIEKLKVTGKPTVNCYGILIEAYKMRHENITLREVEVTGAGMGVHIKRADNVLIEKSNIHANGCVGKERFYHNLYIRACDRVRIVDCTLDRSTTGNGLNISYCKDIFVERTTARDNFFRGMRAAETDGFSVVDCSITGNGGTGLIANQEKGNVTKRIDLRKNTISENRDGGILVLKGSTGSVRDNTARNNQPKDYQIPDDVEQSGNY